MLDLEPATRELAGLVQGIRDEQLDAPTPCSDMSVGDLLDHIDGLSLAFAAAASKTPPENGSQGPSADASRLGDDWRTRIPERLAALASAWKDESAWTGMTQAGGVDMPAEIAGVVALDEVVVHGWDLAVASGQDFTCEPHLLQAVHEFVQSSVAENPEGSPGLFGAPVPVPPDAPLLDQLIGLTGRDPSWRPPSAA
ncbi:TIGR03086 family protein [Actinobacteria bacterium YIM 96077]|uniref:TIGR03086 family protein n=1 Tax=Phytoactinopolyspora halophila TaxID=1981511 RepID=A0A329QL10_9ACTN|nr:TIGR03086 family metal-binding protein [Phytoactinopolyspora halophila]AYY14853.1 TIGR03086 family protein [Actinobacteria bacterium YIM 96077]RAW13127.1 TIGR03086 family protein [Phytoactinopolyspora halophila]